VGRLAERSERPVDFLLCGDFNQFGAIADEWRGTKVDGCALEYTGFLCELCRYRLTLTQNRRSDARLFAWYASLIPGGSRHEDVEAALAEARATFRPNGEPARYTLCMSHAERKRVNVAAKEEASEGREWVAVQGVGKNQDNFRAYVGMEVIGSLTHEGVRNGCFYNVVDLHAGMMSLWPRGGGELITLSILNAGRALRPSHALTIQGCQGLTLEGRLRVLNTTLRLFRGDYKKLFVALSRATSFDLLEVLP